MSTETLSLRSAATVICGMFFWERGPNHSSENYASHRKEVASVAVCAKESIVKEKKMKRSFYSEITYQFRS